MAIHPPPDLQEDFDDFFDMALCGYVTATPNGEIVRANARLGTWLGCDPATLTGKRFSDLLTIGGKIYFETHLSPLLRMQGFFDEVALELSACDGTKLPVLANGCERRAPGGEVLFKRFSIFRAADRRVYEENLRTARTVAETALATERETALLREQFIAVLGHDLRNPLGGVSGALALLKSLPLDARGKTAVRLAEDSAGRMAGLINDIMDFARGRLGSGMVVDMAAVDLEPALHHVVDEIRASWPERSIEASITIPGRVYCDPQRLCQLLSNLLSNAVVHGAPEGPVRVAAQIRADGLEISVTNQGKPIAPDALGRLFEPFTRESHRPSQNGLGLGLYIASQIAQAHGGRLWAVSDDAETRFTFAMPVGLTS